MKEWGILNFKFPIKNLNFIIKIIGDNKLSSIQIPTYKLIENGNSKEVRKRLNKYSCTLHSKVQADNYIKSLNMADILDLPLETPFQSIFHNDHYETGSIFQSNKSHVYLYKCHAEKYPFTGDLVQVVQKLLNINRIEALKYLIKVMEIQIVITEQIQSIREQCDLFMNILLQEDLKETYPAVHSIFRTRKRDVVSILTIFRESIYEDRHGNLRCLTWMSTRNLSLKIYDRADKFHIINKVLNLLTLTGWIDKLENKDIPPELLEKIQIYQREKGYTKKSNVFELLELNNDFFEILSEQCEQLKEDGFTMTASINREYVLRTYGEEKADKIFPQDSGKEISERSYDIEKKIVSIIFREVDEKGYAEQKEVIEELGQETGKTFADYKFKQLANTVFEKYGLEKRNLNNSLKKALGVEDRYTVRQSPKVILRTKDVSYSA